MTIIDIKNVECEDKPTSATFKIQDDTDSTVRFAAENAVLEVANLLGISFDDLLQHLLSVYTARVTMHEHNEKETKEGVNLECMKN